MKGLDGRHSSSRHRRSKQLRKKFEKELLQYKDIIEAIAKLPRDAKDARIFPKELKEKLLPLMIDFPLQWLSDSFDINSGLLYKWRNQLQNNLPIVHNPTQTKTARRYSVSEKKAIAEACKKHGTQVVHDEQGVSWDTITAVNANPGEAKFSRKRKHHELVIEI